MKEANILWLSEVSKRDVAIVGGKGANLGEMYNSGFPVPPAFLVTTTAFHIFLKKTNLEKKIKEILDTIDVDNTLQIEKKAKEIREIIISAKMPDDLQKEILEAYDHFNVDLSEYKASPGALAILKSGREPVFVSVRSSATAEDLDNASFAGQQDSFINVKGNPELIEHIKKVFASIFTARSIYYRKKKGFDSFVGISAVVQKMINSDKSGVMFSQNPVDLDNDNVLIEAVFGQGEGIVSGRIKPDSYVVSRNFEILEEKISEKKIAIVRDASGITKTIELRDEKSKEKVLKTHEIKQLAEFALKLEKHYKHPQDIEFSIENNEIYILQTRPITTLKQKQDKQEITGQLITQGLSASPGIASGVVKIVLSMDDLNKVKKGDVLVTTMTNPDMVLTMQRASAIVTNEGGITCHAAIISREMGIPSVVGTDNATSKLEDGMEITVDGFSGKVYLGKTESKSVEIKSISEIKTKTKIKVLVDLPDFAERAAKTNAYGVGLVRLEGIIAFQEKHPLEYEKENKLEDYTKMIEIGLKKIAETFIGKEIWVRTSDIRSDEYSTLKGAPALEKNPMLGFHGIRFSLKHPRIFKAEMQAIKNLSEKGHKFGIMFPQIILPEEVKQAKEILNEMKMVGRENIKIGVMIETPAASILIKDICDIGIDFISFGTNDLTQYTLAIDRGNEDIQDLYNENNWAIKKQISRVIRECHSRNPKVETSICGQAGSNLEMVEFLVGCGIDSISVNADKAYEIAELVYKIENSKEKSEEKSGNVKENKEKVVEKPKEENFIQKIEHKIEEVVSNVLHTEDKNSEAKENRLYQEPEELKNLEEKKVNIF